MTLDDQRRKRPGNRARIDQIKDEMDQDVLRTRIAAVIYGAASQWDSYPWDALAGHIQALYIGQADAVIQELGLQTHLAKRIINGKPDQRVRRHVTDWEIVNE
jgi:hypothetical protein